VNTQYTEMGYLSADFHISNYKHTHAVSFIFKGIKP